MTNYEEQDEELDEELRALYAQDNEDDDNPTDSPEDSGTEEGVQEVASEESEPAEEAVDAVEETEAKEKTDTTQNEETVPESRYKSAVVAMNKAQQELAERRKQDGQRDNQIQQLEAQVRALTESLKERQSPPVSQDTESEIESIADLDDLSEARELFPEVINPLTKIIDDLKNQINTIKKESGDFKGVAERLQQNERMTAEQQHWNTILESHPDAAEIAESPDFAEWRASQPPMIINALEHGSAQDVVLALNLYRAAHNKPVSDEKPNNRSSDKLEAARQAATPNVKQTGKPDNKPKVFTSAQIANMTMEEFKKHEADIDKAMAAGEIM